MTDEENMEGAKHAREKKSEKWRKDENDDALCWRAEHTAHHQLAAWRNSKIAHNSKQKWLLRARKKMNKNLTP